MKEKPSKKMILETHGLTVRFGDITVLEDLSFRVNHGEFVGLIGPNGAGKTTLLRVLLGLTPPTEGYYRLASGATVRYVPQQYVLPSHVPVSVTEVIQMGVRRRLSRDRVIHVLDQVGLEQAFARKNFHGLSGGQKQRVIIARAIVDVPDMIFFDEPLSGVDVASKEQIYELLRKFNQDGMTIFFVSHDVDHVTSACDRVLCLDRALHRGCHPVAFSEGEREDNVVTSAVPAECLVDEKHAAEQKTTLHHHH